MKFNEYTFHEQQRTEYPCGQIILTGMMDMGGYDERATVSIAQGVATATVRSEYIEVQL